MRKFLAVLLLIFCMLAQKSFATQSTKSSVTTRNFDVITSDNTIIKAVLTYPKTKQKSYPTVLLLHSFGYNSTYWSELQKTFNDNNFAVITIDFRGHGKSIYNKNYQKKSYASFKPQVYQKFPKDVNEVIKTIQSKTTKPSFSNMVIIGADLGANTAVLVSKDLKIKPKGLVLISPTRVFKGLNIQIPLTEIGSTPILAIASKKDYYSMSEQTELIKFAQGTFDIINTPQGGMGMLLIKEYPELHNKILNWTKRCIYNKI